MFIANVSAVFFYEPGQRGMENNWVLIV